MKHVVAEEEWRQYSINPMGFPRNEIWTSQSTWRM